MRITRRRTACALPLAAVLAVLALPAHAGEGAATPAAAPAATPPRPPGQLSVSGDAMICVVPDEVVIGLGVEHFAATLDASKAKNDEFCTKVLKAIKALDVKEQDIKTDVLNIEIKYRDSNHPSEGIEGYFTRRSYTVTLKDPKRFEEVVNAAVANGANQLSGFEFRTANLRKHRDEARKQAVRAAKEKAEALAAELGCQVGAPQSINVGRMNYFGGWNSFNRWGGGGQQGWSQNYTSHAGEGASGGEALPLGQIGVSAEVYVVFDLLK